MNLIILIELNETLIEKKRTFVRSDLHNEFNPKKIMKNLMKTLGIALFLLYLVPLINSCKRSCPPVLTTSAITDITPTSARSGGNITDDNGCDVIARGVCWATSENPEVTDNKTVDGQGTGTFESTLSPLTPGTHYYVRAYATNENGTGYGEPKEFSTGNVVLPTVTPAEITSITLNTAVSGGNITNNGGGEITAKGVCWSKSENPATADSKTENGTGSASFVSNLAGLCPNTKYYLRAYATNSAGTNYSNQVTFETISGIIFNPAITYGTVTDVEGNTYKTLQTGSQTWMAENLKTTKFNDGTNIPLVTGNTEWANLTTPGYCWYGNDECANKGVYGGLYNWYTVNTGKLCPTGWHVPSLDEWVAFINYLGGINAVTGGKLKETGTSHWTAPNTGATNESGFTALPGGIRRYEGTFDHNRNYGNWWFSTEFSDTDAWRWYMDYESNVYRTNHDNNYGFSIRCMKD
ncbi:MAG TPA: hypothetical protein DDW27_15240 [Bacteroidales bacterium]|nr:hypothetical protein [Bacteroidales bacterium]